MGKISSTLALTFFLLSAQASIGQSSNKVDSLKIEILDTLAFEGFFILGQEKIFLVDKEEISELKLHFKSFSEVHKYFGKKKPKIYMEIADLSYLMMLAKMDYCKSGYDMPLHLYGGGIKVFEDDKYKIWVYTVSLSLVRVRINKEYILKLIDGALFLSTTDKDEEYIEVYTYLNCAEE